MLITLLYEIVLWVLTLLALPWAGYQALVHGKYRQSFSSRCGFGFPQIDKGNRRLIWIHAVSMGETKAVAAVCRRLKSAPDNPIIVVSSLTETGHAEAKKSMPEADYHVYMPFDLYGIVAPIVKRTAPDLVILCESDFWFNFLRVAKKGGATVVLVNGKISERSQARFQLFPAFAHALFSCIDLYCLQSEHYRERFAKLGIPSDKMVVTGNLKFDDAPAKLDESSKNSLRQQWGIPPEDKVLVIGSSHDPEERQLLQVLTKLWERLPSLKVILVPRHPDRFDSVAALLTSLKIPYIRHSQGPATGQNHQVVLVDAMGLLRQSYQIADVALVAGSYTERVGGHNILEPLWFGVPTIYGPHMHSQPELVELVNGQQAGLQLSLDLLEDKLYDLLTGHSDTEKLRDAGIQLVESMRGSTDRTMQAIDCMG